MDQWNDIPARPESPTQTAPQATEVIVAPAPASTTVEAPAKRTRNRATIVLAVVLIVAIVGATVTLVSRAQVAGRLATSDAALDATRADLATSTAHGSELESRVAILEGRAADQLATLNDAEKALTACQDLLGLAVQYATTRPPQRDAAKIASLVVSCFEGKVPRGLF